MYVLMVDGEIIARSALPSALFELPAPTGSTIVGPRGVFATLTLEGWVICLYDRTN